MTAWNLAFKPTFFNESLNLPKSTQKKLNRTFRVLQQDPISANGDAKKLKGQGDKIYRVRLGDYRLFYSVGDGWVKLLSVRKRDERTYETELTDPQPPAVAPPPDSESPIRHHRHRPTPTPTPSPPPEDEPAFRQTALPLQLTDKRLQQWKIPQEYWRDLQGVPNAEAILELDLPAAIVERVLDNLYPRDLEDIAAQPEYVLPDPDNLNRLFDGELTAFLLKLDPDQQKFCEFGNNAPVAVKGGAGTGKSTLAIYRVRVLQQRGYRRILFATYTNALVRYCEQLLQQLLGGDLDKQGVALATVDSLIYQTYCDRYGTPNIAKSAQLASCVQQAIATAPLPGANRFAQRARRDALHKLGDAYILEEILDLIAANGIDTLDDYLNFPRRGRGVPLQAKVREAIWAVYGTWRGLMAQHDWVAWEQIRQRALAVVRESDSAPEYDALVIDEAQDLSPVALRFLLALVPDFSGLYVTADSSQSLYQRGFSWKQVHADLNFKGRTILLKRNYRNTAEIIAACDRIVAETDAVDGDCRHPEPSLLRGAVPQVMKTDDCDRELDAIRQFFIASARRYRIPLHGGAVLCPQNAIARRYAKALTQRGLQAQAISGRDIDLNAPRIKVMTLHSAKGLEFPFVAIVGLEQDLLPWIEEDCPPEEREQQLNEQRRLFYVGCSRAMRALLVCASASRPSAFLDCLQPPEWEVRG